MIENSTRKAWYRSSLGLFLGLKEGIVFICDELSQMCRMYVIFTCKVGPLPVISMVITPLIGVISYNPSYPIIRPFIRVITPIVTSRGPPCVYYHKLWYSLKL